jgi:hypothetical protein
LTSPRENTEEAAIEAHFWSLPSHNFERLDDPALVEHIKAEFAASFCDWARIDRSKVNLIRRHLHVGHGLDGPGRPFLSATFGVTGSTYFFYGDRTDLRAINDWISEIADNQAGNYWTDLATGAPVAFGETRKESS